ncbi:TPA: hypothetical protein ACGU7N_003268 [Vibrio vulnificus]|nr:hypothetical protein [Vibrio vulnificus]MCU8417103.1 hypothetical protein [Vibrio vulnificus]MDK2608276.1 hypothetical protein [Vibrio vulnificus]MDK2610992.1 hypothetical protein [Vibrio vulnificus]MDK2703825.1 hypothetical protein [Vibrio vulnificus]
MAVDAYALLDKVKHRTAIIFLSAIILRNKKNAEDFLCLFAIE